MTTQTDFVLGGLQSGIRPDGRGTHDYRPIKIVLGENFGLAEVAIGASRALCAVEAQIEKPHEIRPSEGFLHFNVDYGFLNAGLQEGGGGVTRKKATLDDALDLGTVIEKLLIGSRAIDKESLCISVGKRVWSLRCDIRVLDHDGNLRDLCTLAALAGILHFRRQEVVLEGGSAKVLTGTESDLTPLSLHHKPVLLTVAFFDKAEDFVVDPSYVEEGVMSSRLSVGVNQHGELCSIHKPGGQPIDRETLQHVVAISARRAKEIGNALEKAFEADKVGREAQMKNVFQRYKAEPLSVPVAKFVERSAS